MILDKRHKKPSTREKEARKNCNMQYKMQCSHYLRNADPGFQVLMIRVVDQALHHTPLPNTGSSWQQGQSDLNNQ